ncbi:coiled-coil alpha-helical rod protein 1-like [Rhopilema esculentum]|uniref:coiled-coil alpha-helical rod protein 1-like n=1 Tax=Rhopilema esculentum TaxID=499914 RepID=UPI0031D0DA04|eukprot:gene15288-6500_t
MATKKEPEGLLLGPSEFSRKLVKSGNNDSASAYNVKKAQTISSKNLVPPSEWTVKKVGTNEQDKKVREDTSIGHHLKQHDDNQKENSIEKRHAALAKSKTCIPIDKDKRQLEDTTKKLMAEIKSCKEDNRKMHEDLAAQLQPLIKVNKDASESTVDQNGPPQDFRRQEELDHKRNVQFQELLQTKVQKQTDNIDKVMKQFLEHQSEINADNEKLRRKYSRLNEEYKDVKIHLEKQLEMKEKQCKDYVIKLQVLEDELQKMERQSQTEIHRLNNELKMKETTVTNLQSIKDASEKVFQQLQASRDAETKTIITEYDTKLASLKLLLSKHEKDLQQEADKKKDLENTLKEKEKLFEKNLQSKDDEVNVLKDQLESKEKGLGKLTEELELSRNQVEELKFDMQTKQELYEKELADMKKNQENCLKGEIHKANTMKAALGSKSSELENAKAEIKQLHDYIAEKQSEEENPQSWKARVNTLTEDNSQLKETCASLESAVQFLNIHVSSLNNVIKIQETELLRDGTLLGGERIKRALSTWREKVFSLLVQLKSLEILDRDSTQKLQNQLKDFKKQSQENKTKIELLEAHLAEKNADLEVKSSQIRALSVEVSSLQEKLSKQEQKNEKASICVASIKNKIEVFEKLLSEKFEPIENKLMGLRSLANRVTFAHKRLGVIKDLFDRKEAHLKSKFEKIKSSGKDDEGEEELTGYDKKSLLAEIEHLTNDRKVLTDQVRRDTEKLTTLEKKMKDEYEVKLKSRNEVIERLETELELSQNKNEELRYEISIMDTEHAELNKEITNLKFDLERAKSEFEKEIDSQLGNQSEKHFEESSKMERMISETKREHTKAIVSLQQIERQLEWQIKNHQDIMKEKEEEYNYELSKLIQKCQELEKERNLLLTTIKQENIKLPLFKDMTSKAISEHQKTIEKQTRAKKRKNKNPMEGARGTIERQPKNGNDPKLSEMLKELQSISASLLQEDDTLLGNEPQTESDRKSDEL